MIGYKEGCVLVDGSIPVITREREICSANLLSVKAGTNGYQGGDSGHGSRTYFKIKDDGSTDLRVNVKKDMFGHTEEFEVVLGGDCELSTILTALKFIVHTLEEQIEEASGCV